MERVIASSALLRLGLTIDQMSQKHCRMQLVRWEMTYCTVDSTYTPEKYTRLERGKDRHVVDEERWWPLCSRGRE